MSVTTAHNIVLQLGLTDKEKKQLAKVLTGKPVKKANTRFEEMKEDFKARCRRAAERRMEN